MRSYAVAAIAGPAISLLIRKRFETRALKASGARLIYYNSWSTFVACSAAGFLNTIVMRWTETRKGVDVYLPPSGQEQFGECVGHSQIAAKKAVM